MSIRTIPSRPSLELDKKQAKRLLRAARERDQAALQRLAESHPRFAKQSEIDVAQLKLADMELVLAREYGFASWGRYKHFVEALLTDRVTRAATLLRAVCSNQLSRGVALLKQEPELARFDFYVACACGELEHVERALEKEPELAQRTGGALGWQPLVYTSFSRFWRTDAQRATQLLLIARALLERGADPNGHYYAEHDGSREVQTCLYAAAGIANHAELTALLLNAGASVDEEVGAEPRMPAPTTAEQFYERLKHHPLEALYHATEFKDVRCLRLLLEAGPTPLSVSYCLGRALDFDNEEASLLYLRHGADPRMAVPWDKNRSHLHKAVIHRRSLRVLRAMLEGGGDPNLADDLGLSPYRLAVRRGEREITALLEQYGGDRVLASDEDRAMGALVLGERVPGAELKPEPDLLVRAARRGDLAEMKRLLTAGADVNAILDLPPLHGACYAGQLAAAQLLVEHGARLEQVSGYGGTPLGTCIYGSSDCFDEQGGPGSRLTDEVPARGYAELVDWLLERGGKPPKSIQTGSEKVQEVLRRHGVLS